MLQILSKQHCNTEDNTSLPAPVNISERSDSSWESQKAALKKGTNLTSKSLIPSVIESPIYSILQIIAKSEVELLKKVYEIGFNSGKNYCHEYILEMIFSTNYFLDGNKEISTVVFK